MFSVPIKDILIEFLFRMRSFSSDLWKGNVLLLTFECLKIVFVKSKLKLRKNQRSESV